MTYLSLYRKYRSQTFDEIIGQEHIVQTLKNAIRLNRLAHAYLFTGPRGTGKTSTARILAKALNCRNNSSENPCNACDNCQKITAGNSVDVIEIDAASNRGIDEIRDLREKVRYMPVEGRYKIYIIDEVHMLTSEAFNALLKTLEEPPAHLIFVLATTEIQKVPATILSRCQRFDFHRIDLAKVKAQLTMLAQKEGFEIEGKALDMIARTTEGSMRDAISLLDQLFSFCDKKVMLNDIVAILGTASFEMLFDLADVVIKKDRPAAIKLIDKIISEGRAVRQVAKDFLEHFRYLLLVKVGSAEVLGVSDEHFQQLKIQASQYTEENISQILQLLTKVELDMRWHPHARLIFEVAMLNLIDLVSIENKEDKSANIESLRAERSNLATKKTEIASSQVPRNDIRAINPIQEDKVEIKIEPEPIQAVANESPIIQRIKEKWDEILQLVKEKTLFGYVSLHEGEPLEVNSKGKLVIRFRKGFSFHKDRLLEIRNKSLVEEVLEKVLNQKIMIDGLMADSGEKISPDALPNTMDMVKEVFGAELIK